MNFKPTHLLFGLLATLCLTAAANDLVTLKKGNTVTGKILSLGQDLIEIKSPHALAPLKIKGSQLQHLQFESLPVGTLPTHSQQITLRNGDIFPAEVTSLDQEKLHLQTWFAGPLAIDRSQVKSVHYGVKPQPLIYQGPRGIEGWSQSGDWQAEDDDGRTLYSTNNGSIGRNLNLPKNFIFRTRLRWQNAPNIRLYLCADSTSTDEITHAYRIGFGNQGIQIERLFPQEALRNNSAFLGGARVKPDDLPDKLLDIELRVNRSDRSLRLYLNGKLHGTFRDQATPPSGTIVVLESRSSGRRTHQIEQLSIHQWDTITQRLHREGPSDDPNVDSVSVSDGDRYSGKIISITPDTDGTSTLTVRTPLLDTPLQIPSSDCSVIHFTGTPDEAFKPGSFGLALTSGGTLGLLNIQLGEQLKATHPLLGQLTLDRRILSQITRRPAQEKNKP